MRFILIASAGLWLVAACHGPAQKAGEQQDQVNANLAGQNYTGEGPNERIGESVDRADRAAREARQAAEEATKKQGEAIRRQADVGATRLDEEAKAVRADAAQRAKALSNDARQAPR
ncbi:hypothetical protein SCH01S_49_00120 [Sphingomonas changbaiensis NBRC 104936]|jgi:hypothetical protein|uniref:Lipoprotein n=1 Tax=Sphingomonas changbaiensis NBRC 104936 TaxID=1219043 RepID=A0A0E9MSZ7_9SPHN|nr:hypothetical protein [Sphingomonas changbaiensis]GAO40598.1 hypothetical protein SCH01S_49_00120 [Sphingomonas changbaiensis NBRC 104936]